LGFFFFDVFNREDLLNFVKKKEKERKNKQDEKGNHSHENTKDNQ